MQISENFSRQLAGLIEADAVEIQKQALKTPLVRLSWLDAPGRTVWAKLECKQLTNSFKFRGAYNAIRKLDPSVPVVTASAGNHGLAIAYVAGMLHRKCRIFVPAAASELKLRRLIGMGAEVIPVGRDLFEATQSAKAFASEIGGQFISPFSHPDVIVGQGSIAVEVLEQQPVAFDQILIPLGGGGLLAGIGALFRERSSHTEIIALHPSAFDRSFECDGANAFLKPVLPTIADGLAVQHEDNALGPLLMDLSGRIENVDESAIETAVVAMLHKEGLLVEGAGAISVGALLNDPDGQNYRGNILLLICGGNISTSSLMQALATHTDDPKLARLAGHRSVSLPAEAVRYRANRETQASRAQDPLLDAWTGDIWRPLLANLIEDIVKFEQDLHRHQHFIATQKLDTNNAALTFVSDELKALHAFIKALTDLDTRNEETIRSAYRMAVQAFSCLRNSLSWCSASVDQSKRVMFFDPAENNHSGVNYDRYGSSLLRERELALVRALGHDPEVVDLLLTSSGPAAYSVIESFLLRDALPAKPTIVTAPYIYFEAAEQVATLKQANFVQATDWDLDSIIDLVEGHRADMVMLDPLANLGTLHTIDFHELARRLEKRDWSDKWLVIDGTMVSGGLDIFSIFNATNHPQILYYESGSKYLQFGLDLQMAGVVLCRKVHLPDLARHRRNLGAVMYQNAVTRFPRYGRDQFMARMLRLTANADLLSQTLRDFDPQGALFEVAYPAMWKGLGWSHGGGVVSLTMRNSGLNNRGCLDYLIDRIIYECRESDVPITKGVSFGFSTTRVSAAAAMANDMPPFLRFSIGEEPEDGTRKLANAVTRALAYFFATFAETELPKSEQAVPMELIS